MAATVLRVGDSLAGYTIEGTLGRGGMGAVYLATHKRLNRKAALKVLVPELADDEPFRARFIRESQIAASLDHPNVIPIYDADEIDGVLFIAMRYVEGSDLRQLLREHGHLSLGRTIEIIGQVAGALDVAHAANLVHRDVKPANILIEQPSGRVFLSDFGLAKNTSSAGMTRTGSFLGSVDYCSPEQIHGQPLDGRADIYSLGGVTFNCLAGQPPFPKDSEIAVIQAHLNEPIPALSTLRPELPLPLDGVLATAMAKYPPVRYGSAGAFAAALKMASTADGSAATAHTAPLVGATSAATHPLPSLPVGAASFQTKIDPPTPTAASAPPSNPSRKKHVIAAGIALLLILVAVVAAVIALQKPSRPAPAAVTPPPRVRSTSQTFNSDVRLHLETQIIPYQTDLTNHTKALQASTTSFALLEGAGSTLEQQDLKMQGWATTLHPSASSAQATLRALNTALGAQVTYAATVSNLPSDPAQLTAKEARSVIADAGAAEDAFLRLAGAAPSLPSMPLSQADDERLLSMVPRPRPAVSTLPAPSQTPNLAASQAAIEATIDDEWTAVNNGNYPEAFDYFSPQLQASSGRTNWIQDKETDQPQASGLSFGAVTVSGATADVDVSFETVGNETGPGNTGCNDWSGYYQMVDISGAWYINASDLNRTNLTC